MSTCPGEEEPGAVLPGHQASRKLTHLLQIAGLEIPELFGKEEASFDVDCMSLSTYPGRSRAGGGLALPNS